MPPNAPILQASHVRKAFAGEVIALDAVDIDIFAGEWLAVTGTSGSGKTTLLHLFAALDNPDAGKVLYRGTELTRLRDLDGYRRRSIGVVFQLHNLLPHLNVRDNVEVAMLGTHAGGRARSDRVSELMAAVGLEAQQLRKPPQLSGGERQRAAIARALANSPEILLADEPTGSLDPGYVTRIMDLFARLNHQRGMTIIMVTHDPAATARAARTITLEAGRLIEPEPARA